MPGGRYGEKWKRRKATTSFPARNFLPNPNARIAEPDLSSAPVSQSRSLSSTEFSQELREVLGGAECFVDLAEICMDLRTEMMRFVDQNLRAPTAFGFLAESLVPIDVSALRDAIEERVIRLRLLSAKSEIVDPRLSLAEEAVSSLDDFLFDLRSASPEGILGEGIQESFFLELLELSEQLVELGIQGAALRFSERIQDEQTSWSDLGGSDSVLRISENSLMGQELVRQVELEEYFLPHLENWTRNAESRLRLFVGKHREREPAPIGFHSTGTSPEPVEVEQLNRTFEKLSSVLEESFQGLTADTPSSLNYLVYLQRCLSACGILRVTMTRRFQSGVVGEGDLGEFLKLCATQRRKMLAGFRQLSSIAQSPAVRMNAVEG